MHYGMWGGFMWIWWVLGAAFIALMVYLVIQAAGFTKSGPSSSRPRQETPEDILRKRYARGEIDKDEYENRLKELHAT